MQEQLLFLCSVAGLFLLHAGPILLHTLARILLLAPSPAVAALENIHAWSAWFVQRMFCLQILQPFPAGGEPCIVISNHETWADFAVVVSTTPKTVPLVKHSLFYIPIVGPLWWLSKVVFVNRASAESRQRVRNDILQRIRRDGMNVVVYSQGTRQRGLSFARREVVLKRGIFEIAAAHDIPVVVAYHNMGVAFDDKRMRQTPGARCSLAFSQQTLALTAEEKAASDDPAATLYEKVYAEFQRLEALVAAAAAAVISQ